jgi:O-antigen ligase
VRLTAALETPAFVVGGAAAASLAAYALVEVGPVAAVAIALLPVLAFGIVYLVTTGQALIFMAGLVIPVVAYPGFGKPIVGTLYYQDVFAGLALGALLFSTLLARGSVPPIPRTPILGLPFVLFGAAIAIATFRGHFSYGAALFGQPLRWVFYAVIIAGLAGMTVPRMYRLLQITFYAGALYATILALAFLAAGGGFASHDQLSTGGSRLLAITTSIYSAGALFFALLNLRLGVGSSSRVVHLTFGAFGLFGLIVGFGRAAYAASALIVLIILLTSPRVRSSIFTILPLAAPVLVMVAIGFSQLAPDFVADVKNRMFSPPETDINVQWRVEANKAVLPQFRENPLFGVGFGTNSEFLVESENAMTGRPEFVRVEIGQDPHNGYIYFLAGGGLVALGAFALILLTFARDVVRRYRGNADPHARLLILWSCCLLFVFLFNAASGTAFTVPENILTIWALLVLPAIVPLGQGSTATDDDKPAGEHKDVRLYEIGRGSKTPARA